MARRLTPYDVPVVISRRPSAIAAIVVAAIAIWALAPHAQTVPSPKVEFTQPADGARIDAAETAVVATITDELGLTNVVVRVNGERVPGVTPPKDAPLKFTINTTVPLSPGENVIGITATNKGSRITQGIRTVMRSAPAVAAPAKPRGEWYAVVIGVGEYEDKQIPLVPFAVNDATAVHTFMTTKAGYKPENALLVTDTTGQKPTLANIKRALDDIRRRARKDDTVFVYYAGHGAPEMDAAGKQTDGLEKYLVPRDAESASLFSTALSMENIEQIFQRLQAERVVIALDTSFSGRASARSFTRQTTRSGSVSSDFLDRVARAKGRVILTASSANQVALDIPEHKHGLFTWFMLQGMAGAADADSDGIVTINELFSYVQRTVAERARVQNERQSPGMAGAIGDLPFVIVQK